MHHSIETVLLTKYTQSPPHYQQNDHIAISLLLWANDQILPSP